MNKPAAPQELTFAPEDWLPPAIGPITDHQTDLPRIAKDPKLTAAIEAQLPQIPTTHALYRRDARAVDFLPPDSVHLVVTSPPYWTLKDYNPGEGQMGEIADYEEFLAGLDRVWRACFDALVPGGRLICVVGDVCLSRRKNKGEHMVMPLHASIQEHCRRLGFNNLAPIIWHKIANAAFEAEGNGGGFLGKPYEPNSVIKNDIEFILMERKPGGYRSPSVATRILSVIPAERHRVWFQQIWTGVNGASTRQHPAPYPLELAERLVRMFSFVGDTVLDPFMGARAPPAARQRAGAATASASRWTRRISTWRRGASKPTRRSCSQHAASACTPERPMLDVEKEMRKAVRHFWTTRSTQRTRQGAASGQKDAGDRAAVTGGKHADGFIELIARIVRESGLPDAAIRASAKSGRTLPGYFRPTKEWNVVVVWKDSLIATVEVKSQVGSFGNNFNNRVEEAVGSATDFWKAYEYGRFRPSGRPWLGYLFMLEESPDSIGPKKPTKLEPFEVDSEFQTRSYASRYELVCQRLLRERLYDTACFFTSNATDGTTGHYAEPNPELGIRLFAISLAARARNWADSFGPPPFPIHPSTNIQWRYKCCLNLPNRRPPAFGPRLGTFRNEPRCKQVEARSPGSRRRPSASAA